jgi:Tol biopolymer transport system component
VSIQSGLDATPTWAPGGTRLAWISDILGDEDLVAQNLDGGNLSDLTPGSPELESTPAWSPRP